MVLMFWLKGVYFWLVYYIYYSMPFIGLGSLQSGASKHYHYYLFLFFCKRWIILVSVSSIFITMYLLMISFNNHSAVCRLSRLIWTCCGKRFFWKRFRHVIECCEQHILDIYSPVLYWGRGKNITVWFYKTLVDKTKTVYSAGQILMFLCLLGQWKKHHI